MLVLFVYLCLVRFPVYDYSRHVRIDHGRVGSGCCGRRRLKFAFGSVLEPGV